MSEQCLAKTDGILAKNSDEELLFGGSKKLCKLCQDFAMANPKNSFNVGCKYDQSMYKIKR